VDAAGPGRPAEERPDVRLSATRAGQGALLEIAVAGAVGQSSCAVSVHGSVVDVAVPSFGRQLQPPVLLDGLFEKRAGRLRATRAQTTANGARGRRLPLSGAEDTVAHAYAPAVPEARDVDAANHHR